MSVNFGDTEESRDLIYGSFNGCHQKVLSALTGQKSKYFPLCISSYRFLLMLIKKTLIQTREVKSVVFSGII